MNSPLTEGTLLSLLDRPDPARLAIVDVHGNGITYGRLRELVDETHRFLWNRGVGPGDTVATSLRNGPETAASFLALVTYCRVAPLNPSFTATEVAFVLRDVKARAMLTTRDAQEALAAARENGAAPIWIDAGEVPGDFRLTSGAPEIPAEGSTNDIALLLHTSGTTARPKLVPLTQRNLYLSCRNVAAVLELQAEDRCLSIMPLFHIHGLVAGLLASISAGATVICAPGFQATSFFSWLDSSRPTWYTAVPTMHQTILARAKHNAAALAGHRLRAIRSSSSPLYPSVWEQLEETFGVPVLNAYGMTEAAHQIASVRLPGGARFRNTVGTGVGLDIAIMNAAGELLPAGEAGEVVLRGDQITPGYLEPAGANATAFHDGWFRTGDEGVLDAEGLLTLTGRLKEMINSGGEKVSPYEVEEALLAHPGVAQAVAFSAPHELLGEQVAAAVVLKNGHAVTERELLQTAGQTLAKCKMPRKILFVPEIPRGATGKLQRIGLAARLGLS
jgi:acyl-CoA synthetase (AMP-forming)/AMP-acid ligase II